MPSDILTNTLRERVAALKYMGRVPYGSPRHRYKSPKLNVEPLFGIEFLDWVIPDGGIDENMMTVGIHAYALYTHTPDMCSRDDIRPLTETYFVRLLEQHDFTPSERLVAFLWLLSRANANHPITLSERDAYFTLNGDITGLVNGELINVALDSEPIPYNVNPLELIERDGGKLWARSRIMSVADILSKAYKTAGLPEWIALIYQGGGGSILGKIFDKNMTMPSQIKATLRRVIKTAAQPRAALRNNLVPRWISSREFDKYFKMSRFSKLSVEDVDRQLLLNTFDCMFSQNNKARK